MIKKIKGILLEKISEHKLAFPMKKKIDIYNPEQLKTLLVTQKSSEHPEIKTLVTKLLKENSENPEIKKLAVWGAGKFRNDENFEIVKEIALNNTDYGYLEREYAIHSTALYLKDKPDEVRAVMKLISEENSVFAKLGKILNNKVNGILYERSAILDELKNNKEFTGFFQAMKKSSRYNERIEHKLLNAQTDFCLEYPHGIRVSDSVDSFISKNPDYIGTRDFYYGGTFQDGKLGKFHDTIEEVFCSHHYNLDIPLYKLTDASGYNIIAKMIGKYLYKTKPKAQEIAEAAHKNLSCEFLDGIPCGKEEYFAQGVEAYFSPYKPHSKLLTSENTLYKLMDKDPFLYYRLKTLFD